MGIVYNRAQMTVSGTPGTGTITLGSATTGFQSFADAGVPNGGVVSYLLVDGNNWEIGLGTYTSSGTTLARTTIRESTNADAAINASSATIVSIVALAEDINAPGSDGQLIRNSAGQFAGASGLTTTGTELTIASGTKTSNATALDVTQTWNNAGSSFTAFSVRVTNTNSQSTSYLADFSLGGTSLFRVRRDGFVMTAANAGIAAISGSIINFYDGSGNDLAQLTSNNGSASCLRAVGFSSSPAGIAPDVFIRRDAANVLAQRNDANAQELRVYGTFTDLSNHRRVALGMSTAGVGYIRPQGAGTGASGNVLLVSHGAMTVASLPSASANAYARCIVSDANATTFNSIVAGGGSNIIPVYSDGTNWRIG